MGWIYCCGIIPVVFMFERFEQHLASDGSIATKQIPYYVEWIMGCYTVSSWPPDKMLSSNQKKLVWRIHREECGRSNRQTRLYGNMASAQLRRPVKVKCGTR